MKLQLPFLTIVAAVLGWSLSAVAEDDAQKLRAIFDAEWEHTMETSPTWASQLGDRRWNDRWPDVSLAAIEREHEHDRQLLAQLGAIRRDTLSAADRLNYDMFRRNYEQSIEGFRFGRHLIALDQRSGIQTEDELGDALRFETVKDYEDWIARLRAFGGYVDQTIALLREGMKRGLVQPKVTMQRVPAQIAKQLVATPEESPFFKPLKQFAAGVAAADRERLTSAAKAAITESVLPAYQRFEKFFATEYLPACLDGVGAWRWPEGEPMYEFVARSFTTTQLTPKEIHEIGLREVARIRDEMEKVKAQAGFAGSLPDFFTFLRTDPRFYCTDEKQLLLEYRATAKRIDPLLVKLFRTFPRTPYGVEPIPAKIAPDTTAAYYRQPAADGSRAGSYFVNLYKPESRPRWEMMALSLHECVPGHHLQIALAQEQGELPHFRQHAHYTAYIEGWGLYAESLGDELGLYDDPHSKMGQLTYEMWRAVRLVVDTGIHAFRWDREKAIAFFRENAPKAEQDIVNEIDRYISWPGQALAYKIGELRLKELRARATHQLGGKFDVKEFHDVILLGGAMPLSLLEQRVDEWLRSKKPVASEARPRLQILNGSDEPIDIFWLKSDTERVPNGSVEPGTDTIITTTIGHRFAVVGRESKSEKFVASELPVQAFRFGGVPAFYTQSASAGGFSIVASAKVNPYALKESAFLVDQMLAQRADVRAALVKSGARLCIMAHDEYTTDLPEFVRFGQAPHRDYPRLSGKEYWDARARGTGGSQTDPYCTCAEENLLGFPGDPYAAECILIHEFAHCIHLRGMENVDPTFDPRLKAAYDAAMKAGLWKAAYASVNHHEYFAEGVQMWFDNNRENDNEHNHVNTRAELLAYDPGLAALCREVFGDTVIKYTKPATRLTGHMAGYEPAKAPTFVWPERLLKAKAEINAKVKARNAQANGERETRVIAGWSVRVSKALLSADTAATEHALEELKAQLDAIVRLVPAAAVAELKKVPLYVSPEYPGVKPRAEYHPDGGWLREHGRDPAMAKGVEFTNVRIFEAETRRMPNFALHELAHAYHDRFLPMGFGHADVKAAYEKAKAGGKYDRVERQDSEGRKRMDRAYALTNPQEYFAETTEAFFGRNDFFPYTSDQLQQHDPEMFTLLAKLWGGEGKATEPPREAAAAARGEAVPTVRKPNILFILADDLGYGDVGCYNPESKVPTPNLDRLAREGMRFTDAHSPSTVCTPSRYSLLTGRMAFRIPYRGVFAGVGGPCLIEADRLTLPQMLRDQGYATAMTGKWHVGLSFFDKDGQRITEGGVEGVKRIDYSRAIPDAPIHRGFDRFFGTACCPATDFLYAFIDGDRIPVPPTGMLDKSKLPRHPYAFDNRDGLIAPDFDLEEVDMVFLQRSREFLEQHAKGQPGKPFFLLHSTHAAHLPSFASKQFQGSTKAGPHGDFIHELDFIVGELMETLERLGVAENTVVIFSSDNGLEITSAVHMRADYGHDGARPWRGVKRDQWEGGHRVPFIVRWPGKIAAGSTSEQTVCLTDVMATCVAMTGAALPANAAEDSFDLLPVLLGKVSSAQVRPYTLHQTISLALAIRRGPWKYLDHRGSGGNDYGKGELKPFAFADTAPDAPGQLYNLETDPGETVNLYFKHPEIVRELMALLESSKAEGRSAARSSPQ